MQTSWVVGEQVEGTKPLIKKTEAIQKLSPPKSFKQLKSFMGSIHHLTRYMPKLAQIATALRPLLKITEKNKLLDWCTEYNTTFKNIIKMVSEIAQKKHFDQHLDTRIVCDASITGLGAALKQHSPEGWVAVAHASHFLNSLEEKYSVNELELLGVVWAIERFKYYLYGKHFTVITDHQALISALNASERSKTSRCRLTRWNDRLIPFHFDIKHLAGYKMRLIDYMSRNPVRLAKSPSEYDEEFFVASFRTFIKNLEMIDNVILNNLANQNKTPHELIKKRAKKKWLLNAALNTQLSRKTSKHSATGHCQTKTEISLTHNLLYISQISFDLYLNSTK